MQAVQAAGQQDRHQQGRRNGKDQCTSRVCFRLKLTIRELFYILEIDIPLLLPLAVKGLVLLHESPE